MDKKLKINLITIAFGVVLFVVLTHLDVVISAISTVLRGTEKKVDTPFDKPSDFCVGCLSCANVCPTVAIEYSQTEKTRTIWNREFDLLFCEECGNLMGTPESVRHAVGAQGNMPTVCDACRKKKLANEMMQTYRYV